MKFILFTTVLFSGLISGLFFAYSCSVNPGLKALPDTNYIKAMQSINSAIQNPVFLFVFMGLLVLLPISAFQLHARQTQQFYLLMGALLFYFIGVFGVTVLGNVPLNERLARFSLTSSNDQEIAQIRQSFEGPWNLLHSIRTVAAMACFALEIVFTLQQKW